MTFTAIDYIANKLHQQDCRRKNEIGPRWWCLRADMKAMYRMQAKANVAGWRASERTTERNRPGRLQIPTGAPTDA